MSNTTTNNNNLGDDPTPTFQSSILHLYFKDRPISKLSRRRVLSDSRARLSAFMLMRAALLPKRYQLDVPSLLAGSSIPISRGRSLRPVKNGGEIF